MIMQGMLDQDLYKFSMQHAVCQLYPCAVVRYEFFNRGIQTFPEGFDDLLRDEIQSMETMSLTGDERCYMEHALPFFTPVYLDFLSGYRYNPDEVYVKLDEEGRLHVSVEGPWYRAILWEVPLLAIISELYFRVTKNCGSPCKNHNKAKAHRLEDIPFADFGTRRRYSYDNHDMVVCMLSKLCRRFVGTSNVHLAMKHGVKPIGTQAHEWFSYHGTKYGYRQANSVALGRWVDVYHGALGIALTDTFTTKAFWPSFDLMYSKLFDGVRHDSGDPYVFGRKTIQHYTDMGIDPYSKTIVFSDGITTDKAVELYHEFCTRVKVSFGIGTHLTNDVGTTPLNIVIKMVSADGRPAIKLSDEPGKETGDASEIKLSKQVLGISER